MLPKTITLRQVVPRQAVPLAGSTISQADSEASQLGPSQAVGSQMTSSASPQDPRPSPLPNRHNSPQGSSSCEESNPK